MRICWDNLEKLRYSQRTGKWYQNKNTFHYIDECEVCGESFLSQNKKGVYCSLECSWNSDKNKKLGYELGKRWKGKRKTKKHRENISKTKKGQNSGKDNYMYGKNHTEETKKKISKSKIGHRKGVKRERHSLRMLGKGNPNWQGGKTLEEYCEVWKDKDYKESILERDGYECKNPLCRQQSNKLCGHHIDYDKKNCSPGNVITVCFSCNARANFNREFWQKHYKEIIING